MIHFDDVRASRRRIGAFLSPVVALLAVVVLAGCGATDGELATGPTAAPTPDAPATPAATASGGWELAVIYTAVEKFHTDKKVSVTGCTKLQCSDGTDKLGKFPAGFVKAVKDQGSGRLTDGRYLNWSYDVGYWLDTAPRNASGGALEPFVSAAADPAVLPQGTGFTVTGCGQIVSKKAKPPAEVCDKLTGASWEISDEFTPGSGGDHHVDLYIGEETKKHFQDSQWYNTLQDATLTLSPGDQPSAVR
jgi:hypothetical protein